MQDYSVPYGKDHLSFRLPKSVGAELVVPPEVVSVADPLEAVDSCLTAIDWTQFEEVRSAAIAINDKTRPVPHQYLLPPLLTRLESLSLLPEVITLIIATGTHPPMRPEEFSHVVPTDVISRFPIVTHDADERENLLFLGTGAFSLWPVENQLIYHRVGEPQS